MAETDGRTQVDEINAWIAVRMEKTRMREAVE